VEEIAKQFAKEAILGLPDLTEILRMKFGDAGVKYFEKEFFNDATGMGNIRTSSSGSFL